MHRADCPVPAWTTAQRKLSGFGHDGREAARGRVSEPADLDSENAVVR